MSKLTGANAEKAIASAGPGTNAVPMIQQQAKPRASFPMHIYPPNIQDSFHSISKQYSIPIDYLGVTGLFVVAALSGNLFKANIYTGVKPILYTCLIGPSGTGKTPAYKHLCADIIAPLRKKGNDEYRERKDQHEESKAVAKSRNDAFTEKAPTKKIRIITDGTMEAITKYAEICPAGFGVVYDEGGRFFTGANAYKKDTSSVDFWNEIWNGSSIESLRVDSDRDRFVANPAVSVIFGMQKDRIMKYFTEDTVASGLLHRFLLCESDYIQLNENVDPFGPAMRIEGQWRDLVEKLYEKGVIFQEGSETMVEFNEAAKARMRYITSSLAKRANHNIREAKDADESKLMIGYAGKLQAYIPRLALILAIIDNYHQPVIEQKHVDNAFLLHEYFSETAKNIMTNISSSSLTGLNEMEQKLFAALPSHFNIRDAEQICEEIGASKSYFNTIYRRKLKNGYIIKNGKGTYEKQ